ncbi:MAG: alpha/beta fold hydrolase [Rhodospirillaceae bacterium]|nr:alpha/beta fold hydrolase [Rhodospirillaceae bacterium]
MDAPAFLSRAGDGATIAYRRTEGRGAAASPTVVFLPGFRSDMEGGKALALEAWCRSEGRGFLRFDYTGHGLSSGAFEDGTIGQWADDAVFAIEALTAGPLVLVGSSMGGWIMMLAARALAERNGPRRAAPQWVAGLVGIAPAPDFTEDLIMANASPALRRDLERDGVHYERSDYSDEPTPITRRLIEDGRERLVLRAPFPFAGPVRIIQGMADPDVPWRHALKVADAFAGADVEIALVKAGDHRLSEPHDLDRLIRTTGEVCRLVAEGAG